MKKFSLIWFLIGVIVGIIVMGAFLYFKRGNNFSFLNGEDKNYTIKFKASPDGFEPVETDPKGNKTHSKIQNYRNFHKVDSPAYYIDTIGFTQIFNRPNTLLKIEIGCNGVETGKANHQYSLLFSGYDTVSKKQFFAMMPTKDSRGRAIKIEAYLDKTCPCPLQGTNCPCEN